VVVVGVREATAADLWSGDAGSITREISSEKETGEGLQAVEEVAVDVKGVWEDAKVAEEDDKAVEVEAKVVEVEAVAVVLKAWEEVDPGQ